MLNTIDVRCPYHAKTPRITASLSCESLQSIMVAEEPATKRMKTCGDSGDACAWIGSYGDFLSKHLGECPLHLVPCPRECGEVVPRKDLLRHKETCAKSFNKCEICGELVKPGEMQEHRRSAAELHVQLLETKLEEERCRTSRSSADQATLDDVLASVKALPKSQQQHVTNITRARADDIKAEVRRQLSKSAIWKIPNAARVMRSHASLTSPAFALRGYDLTLTFYPHGEHGSKAGCACIGVTSGITDDIQMRVKYILNSNELNDDEIDVSLVKTDEACDGQNCFDQWPVRADIINSIIDDTITVKIQVLEVSHVAEHVA